LARATAIRSIAHRRANDLPLYAVCHRSSARSSLGNDRARLLIPTCPRHGVFVDDGLAFCGGALPALWDGQNRNDNAGSSSLISDPGLDAATTSASSMAHSPHVSVKGWLIVRRRDPAGFARPQGQAVLDGDAVVAA